MALRVSMRLAIDVNRDYLDAFFVTSNFSLSIRDPSGSSSKCVPVVSTHISETGPDGRFQARRDVYIQYNAVATALARSEGWNLRRLGKALHLSKSRALIVKLDSARFLKPGTRACDSKLKTIGIVTDILGPVSAPYVSIRPSVVKPELIVGRTLYALED